MKKLHLFMLKSFVGPFVATFFISMFVLIMQFLWRYIDDLVGKGLEGHVISHLLFYVSMTLVPMGLPLAVLLASIMTFGAMGENYELTAMKAAGISLYRIMKPLIVLIVILTIGAFFFSNNVLPYANLKASSLLYDIKRQKPELSLKEGVFINDIDGYSIKVDKIDKKTGMMYGMLIYNHTDRAGNYEVTIADSGIMEADPTGLFMEVELYHGYTYTDEGMKTNNKKTYPFRRVRFDKQFFVIPLSGNELKRSDEDLFKNSYGMLNIRQLDSMVNTLNLRLGSRKQGVAVGLIRDSYVKRVDRNPKRDSVIQQETQGQVKDLDSLRMSLDSEEWKNAMEQAVQFARNAQTHHRNDLMINDRDEEAIRKISSGTVSSRCHLLVLYFSLSGPRWEELFVKEVWARRSWFRFSCLSCIILFG